MNVDEDENCDPLTFFRVHGKLYPLLTLVVRRLMCIPATSVPAESLFSRAGLIHTESRNKLNPNLLEYYCFLNNNQNIE